MLNNIESGAKLTLFKIKANYDLFNYKFIAHIVFL